MLGVDNGIYVFDSTTKTLSARKLTITSAIRAVVFDGTVWIYSRSSISAFSLEDDNTAWFDAQSGHACGQGSEPDLSKSFTTGDSLLLYFYSIQCFDSLAWRLLPSRCDGCYGQPLPGAL